MTAAVSEVTETFCLCTAGDKHIPVTRCVRNTDCTAHSSTAPSFHRAGTASPHSAEGPSPLRPLFPEQHSHLSEHTLLHGEHGLWTFLGSHQTPLHREITGHRHHCRINKPPSWTMAVCQPASWIPVGIGENASCTGDCGDSPGEYFHQCPPGQTAVSPVCHYRSQSGWRPIPLPQGICSGRKRIWKPMCVSD